MPVEIGYCPNCMAYIGCAADHDPDCSQYDPTDAYGEASQ